MSNDYVDIWSEKEVIGYLNHLIQKGSVKKCSHLKLELGHLNAYYPLCAGGHASREEARNVKTSPDGDSTPKYYVWPVCPQICLFFKEATDFPSSLSAKKVKERVVEEPLIPPPKEPQPTREKKTSVITQKETLVPPEKEPLVIPEIVEIPIVQPSDEKAAPKPETVLKKLEETIQRIGQTIPEIGTRRAKRSPKKKGSPVSEPPIEFMNGQYVDIWSEKEVIGYLNHLIQKGSVKKCSHLKLELGHLNAYYPLCAGGHASREEAHNVKTSPDGDSAPKYYVWPVCPEICLFFKETKDFLSSLLTEEPEERTVEQAFPIPEKPTPVIPKKQPLPIPEKEPLVIPELVEVPVIQKREKEKILEPEKPLRKDEEITERADLYVKIDLYLPEMQMNKLKKLSAKTGLSVLEHIQRAIEKYLSKQ